jgi:DUF4097 and DUF4098 domain-containing protein YvlB
MRRGSVIGPLILIGLGVLFLFRNLWPEIPLVDLISRFWPFLLIAWGAIRLFEIGFWWMTGKPLPRNGISGGEWTLIFVICIVGATMYTAHNAPSWFPTRNAWRRVVLPMGESYDYTLAPVEKPCASNCRIIIENFRGNAKITGAAGAASVKASGQQSIRSFQQSEADSANKQTTLELIQQGDQMIVRTNQDKVSDRVQPNADLDITVPAGASIEAHGRYGDFDVQGINGNVNIVSDNAGVRLENLGGNVQVSTGASDTIRLVDVKGNVELKGRGDDVELQNIAGRVTVNAVYVGEVQLTNLAQPVEWEDPLISMAFEKVPGQVHVSRGEFSGNNVVGPVRLRAHSSDVQLSDFTQSLDLTLDRGDIDLKPGKNLPKIEVHDRSGDIDLALPPGAKFDLRASTDHGDADNEYGDPLHVDESGRGNTITGTTGAGPQLRLETGRGSITVRKAGSDDAVAPAEPTPPSPPKLSNPPKTPSEPLRVQHE